MTRKSVLTASLLGFVALSLVVAVADVAGWRRTTSSSSPAIVTVGSRRLHRA